MIKVKRTIRISLRHLIFTLLAIVIYASSYAQKSSYMVEIINNEGIIEKEIKGQTDSIKFQAIIRNEYFKLMNAGYLLAEIDRSKIKTPYYVKIYTGTLYRWGQFNISQIPEVILSNIGNRKNQFNNSRVDTRDLGKLLTNTIKESDYSGYPFAKVKLDSVVITEDRISAVVVYSAGPHIKYAPLAITSNGFVKSSYLELYLNVRKSEPFNSKKVESIGKKIKQLSFCKLDSLPMIYFENKSCKIALNLSPVKANKVDAMIGFAPNQLDNSKMLATGYANLDLHNLFKTGKRLMFSWNQFGSQSQTLRVMYNHTNLFKSVINVRGTFELFKQDTSFLNRAFKLNIGYDHSEYTINVTSNFISSRLLSNTNVNSVEDIDLIDFNSQFYGIEFAKIEFDNVDNPTRGWSLKGGLDLGAKTILNTTFVPTEFYDSLEQQSLQSNFVASSEIAVPITKLLVGYSCIEIATIKNSDKLFNNDLKRFGGVNSLRGFNELEIYASTFLMLQVEARLLLSEHSRLFGFVDWAYAENKVTGSSDDFLGLGAGLVLDTQSGVFQLVYAVGKSAKQSLTLAESKIHFGYVARF